MTPVSADGRSISICVCDTHNGYTGTRVQTSNPFLTGYSHNDCLWEDGSMADSRYHGEHQAQPADACTARRIRLQWRYQ